MRYLRRLVFIFLSCTTLGVSLQCPRRRRGTGRLQPVVRIFGEEYFRKAEVSTIGGLSAHAGQDLLLKYALAVKDRVKKVYLVHGEPEAANIFQEILKSNGLHQVEYPEWKQVVEF